MMDSQQLLAEYVMNGSETAFRELVARYLGLVYSTALRLVEGDSQLAEDVAQLVFIGLANKARTLSTGVMLGGWLHRHTYHVATRALRGERRRQVREREAVAMNVAPDPFETGWRQIAPLLDEAITQLESDDRSAILLRFFEQRDFRAVGDALGTGADAARMRVNRALEKLHSILKEREVKCSVAVLGAVLTTHAVTAAPAGLIVAVSGAALGGAASGPLTFLKIMATTKLKSGIAALALAGATATFLVQHQNQAALRGHNTALQQEIAQLRSANEVLSNRNASATVARIPRLPVPPTQVAPAPAVPFTEPWPSTNLYVLLTNKTTKLTTAQVEPYLKSNRRNAASLLAGFRTTGDRALLEEAMTKYPRDPQVGFEVSIVRDLPAADRRQWLDAFKQSAPDNALANYLSALDQLRSGQTDQAVEELVAASGKPRFQDYSLERTQNDEEAFQSAGYPAAEAKIVANVQLLLPQLVQVRDLGREIVNLADRYGQAGDDASRQAALQMAVALGRRYSDAGPGEVLIAQLVGISVERTALTAMDPASPYGNGGQTVQDRLDLLKQQRDTFRALSQQADPLWQNMSGQDWMSYHSRSAAFGEESALRWLIGKYASN